MKMVSRRTTLAIHEPILNGVYRFKVDVKVNMLFREVVLCQIAISLDLIFKGFYRMYWCRAGSVFPNVFVLSKSRAYL